MLRHGSSALRRQLGVTPRQKAFVDEYVRNGGCGAKAWRKVYRSDYRNPNVPAQSAYLALRRPSVQSYLKGKLRKMIKRGMITEDAILSKYEEAWDLARAQAKPSDMIAAATAQAKLVGLLRDRIEAGAPGSFANMENVSDVLEELGNQIGEDAALQIGRALGVLPEAEPGGGTGGVKPSAPEPVTSEPERAVADAIQLLEADSPSDAVN